MNVTGQAAQWITSIAVQLPSDALAIARLSVFDCLAVAIAGAQEPVSQAVRALVKGEAGAPQSSALGLVDRVPARAAALLNGAAAHALDYDDTHFDFVGHPTVAVLPAALAVGELVQANGAELQEAFLVGAETTCRIGAWLGRAHYNAGFHQTATSGAFGAAAASGRLLGLNEEQMRHALGLVATRASGLKCQFGTMGKPFHAGMAASTGVEAALLAGAGFISRSDALECAGGFAATHQGAQTDTPDVFAGLPDAIRFVDVQYKFHACCHGTHPALEALGALVTQHAVQSRDVARVVIEIAAQWLPVCCIPQPATGLEAKFSLAHVAALLLAGIDTSSLQAFSDENCRNADIVRLARLVNIVPRHAMPDTAATVRITMHNGGMVEQHIDLHNPLPYEPKAARLRSKAAALLGLPLANTLWSLTESLPSLPAADLYPRLHELFRATAAS